jgi:hypothetical protein
MERAGMVHALQKIHRLLRPDGHLIDIHPTSDPASIEVRLGLQTTLAGWLHENDDYVEYEYADEALAKVAGSGLFVVERAGVFQFVTHAASIAELRDFLTEEWEDASIDDITGARVDDLMSTPERDKEVILRESIRIARLRPLQV